jgi:glycosyltransferase involved in cell wall biosynthesis
MAEAAAGLLADPGRRRAMGRAARDRVAARFTWRGQVETLEATYRTLLRGGHPG